MCKSTLIVFLLGVMCIKAQVGIGTTDPAAGTLLHVDDGNGDKGFLPPVVDIADLSTAAPLPNTLTAGTVVFNQSATTEDGYYFWNGTQWNRLTTSLDQANNIYTQDGTLTETRNVDTNGFELHFEAEDAGRRLRLIPAATGNNNNPFTLETNNSLRFDIDDQRGLEIQFNRQLRLGQYGSGIFTGNPAYSIYTDANGRLIEEAYVAPYSAKFSINPQYTATGAEQMNVNQAFVAGSNDIEVPIFGNVIWNDDVTVTDRTVAVPQNDDLTIHVGGRYRFTVNLSFESATERVNLDAFIEVTRGGTDLFPGAKHSTAYIRSLTAHNHSSISFTEVLELEAGDDISIIVVQEAAPGTVYFRNGTETPGVVSNVFIERLR
ncbi:hypothetical protein [Nonlabens xiamenensis]|uniref:hypothetical protein n=1 Tax=Nonlabens xiamenensis TaxID=2341043 RepID=UPI000F6056B8|nr:hypothetical protein [Nonlabens xiamenensis]